MLEFARLKIWLILAVITSVDVIFMLRWASVRLCGVRVRK